MRNLKHILFLVITLSLASSFGQQYTAKAYGLYQAGAYEEAKVYVDSAVTSNERFHSQLWQLRGLVYRKLESAEQNDYRQIAIESFVQARTLDEEGKYKEKIDGYLYHTIIRYYNDAVTFLGEKELENSESSYVLYKGKYKKYIDAGFNFNQNDIEYYTALGSEYLKLVSGLKGDQKTKQTAEGIHYFQLVLDIDKNQFGPNLNIGVMYYNNGADLIMNMDPLTALEDIPIIEENAQTYFQTALPFLLESHRIEPERIDVIEAITGCYYGLQDDDNYNKYQQILDEKNLPMLLEKHKANPKDQDAVRELVRIYSTTFKDDEKYKKFADILNKLEE
jgi:tetratricopeptide (TPR) repeat protein